jgi:hypothetical protein
MQSVDVIPVCVISTETTQYQLVMGHVVQGLLPAAGGSSVPVVPRTFRARPLTAINYGETKGATQSYSLATPVFPVSFNSIL